MWRRVRFYLFIVLGLFLFTLVSLACVAGYFLHKAWPEAQACDLTALTRAQQPMSVIGQDGQPLGKVVSDNRIIIPLNQVSPKLVHAVMAAEDKTFYTNLGFDLHGSLRALMADLHHKKVVQGGSTITQQLAKHMIDERGRSLWRKLVELEVAVRLAHTYSKDRIMELYLNEVYWGSGFYGIEAASEGYFHVHASDLNQAQAAMLAGLIRAPNTNSPFHSRARASQREKEVLTQMRDYGFITDEQYHSALAETLNLGNPGPPKGLNSYAVATIVHAVDDIIASGSWYSRQGTEVCTTFLPGLQHWLESSSQAYLTGLRQTSKLPFQASVLIVDNDTGGILAESGGFSYSETPFDRNWNMRRPSGTMLYPWLLAGALGEGKLSPASLMDVRPVTPATQAPVTGPVTSLPLQDLISVNDTGGMLRLANLLGVPGLGGVIGAKTPADVVEAGAGDRLLAPAEIALFFCGIDRHGYAPPFHCVESIRKSDGFSYTVPPSPEVPLISAAVADQTAATLAAASLQGMSETLSPGQNHGVSYGGASVNGHDVWYAGTDGKTTVVVWVGCDQPQSLPAATSPAHLAYPLWLSAITEARTERQTANPPMQAAPGLVARLIRRSDGLPDSRLTGPAAGATLVFLTKEEAAIADKASAQVQAEQKSSDWQRPLAAFVPPAGQPMARPLYAAWQERPLNSPSEVTQTLPPLLPSIITSDNQWIATSAVGEQIAYPWAPIDSGINDAALLQQAQTDLAPMGVSAPVVAAAFAQRKFIPLALTAYISPADAATLVPNPKTVLFPSLGRSYPDGVLYCHLIGGLKLNRRPVTAGPPQRDEVFYPAWQGAFGLEAMAGQYVNPADAGTLRIICDPFGYPQKFVISHPVKPAPVLTTTINQALQQALHSAMASVGSGAGVILDSDNGAVQALISKPDFDANTLLNPAAWQQIASAPGNPLLNKVTQFQGPPGSTFKVVTSLVALRSGALQTTESIPLGSISLPGVNYNFPKEQGETTFQDALAQSRDSYFMRVGLRVGAKSLADGARELGLGASTQFPLGEATGLVPDDTFMLKHHQRPLTPGDAANLSIGQGDLTVTPIQMATLYGALVNGGTRWKPHLLLSETPESLGQVDLPPGVDQAIMAGLHEVTVDGTGTAANVAGFDTWGKTGTAQVGTKDLPRQLAWFCGGFTYQDHHYVAAILTEGTTDELIFGGGTSASVFGQTLKNWSQHTDDAAKLQIAKATGAENDDSVPAMPVANPDSPIANAANPGTVLTPNATPGIIDPGDASSLTAPPRALPLDTLTPGSLPAPRALPVDGDSTNATPPSPVSP